MAAARPASATAAAARAGSFAVEFRDFILRGNVVDLAVGIIIGVAFGNVVGALVKDIITPIIGIFGGTPDFSAIHFTINNSTFLIGDFINVVITFLVIAAVVFFFVVKPVNGLMARFKPTPEPPAATQDCPYCKSSIPADATRCAFCTSELTSAARA